MTSHFLPSVADDFARAGRFVFRAVAFGLAVLALGFLSGCAPQVDPSKALASADASFEKREFEAAKIQYVNVLRAQPTNSHAIMRLGRIYFEQGQLQHAFPLLRHVRDVYPKEVPIREALALIYSIGGTNLWKAEVDALLELDPANETAVMTMLRMARTEPEIEQTAQTLAALRGRAGPRAVYDLAEAEIALRRGDKSTASNVFRRAITVEPTSVLAHLTLGGVLLGEGQTNEGIALLQKASEMSPPHAVARLRYAQALLQTHRVDDGIRVLDEMNAKAPESIPAWTTRAEVAFSRKEYVDARRFISRALAQSPGDPQALRVRSKIDLAENKPADAVQALDLAAKWLSGSAEFQYQLGIANLLNKDLTRAVKHLREAVRMDPNGFEAALLLSELEIARGNSAEAIGLLTGLIQRAPQIGQAKMLLARAYRATGRLDDAIAAYTAAAKQFPTNAAPVVQLGLVLSQKSRLKEARQAFEQALTIEPRNRMAFEQLVQLDVRAGDRAAAADRVQKRISETPDDPLPWLVRSEILRTAGDTAGSEAALRRVLEIEPDSQRALLALAQLYVASGRNTDALAELRRAVEKAPDNVGAWTMIGMISSELGKFPDARAAYDKALQVNPNSWLVLNNLAFLMAERFADVAAGHEFAMRAWRLAPRSAVVADTLGWIEYQRGNYSEALRLLLDAVEELGSNPEVQYHLGMAHYMMGQEEPARVALRQVVDSTTPFGGRDAAKTYLAILDTPTDPATPEIVANLERRRGENPSDFVALAKLASAYANSGSTPKAEEAFEAALKINPNAPAVLARFALLQVQQLNNTNRALDLARRARQAAPEDPTVAVNAGRAAFDAGDHVYAHSLLQDAVNRLPDNLDAQFALARAAYAVGRVDQTTNALQVVSRDPSGPRARQAKAFLALALFSHSPLPTSPSPEVQTALAEEPDTLAGAFARARLLQAKGDAAAARGAFENILAKFPGFLPASRQLALLLAASEGETQKAYDMTLALRQSLPKDDELAASLGRLAFRRGDFRFSVQLLSEVVRNHPRDGDALYQLGLGYLALNQKTEAKTALEKAVEAAPSAGFVDDAKKRLAGLSANGK